MNPLRWWLRGYLTGDCSIDSAGRVRTSSSNLRIVRRLKTLLDGGWVELRRSQKPLTIFTVKDPLIIKSIIEGRRGRLWPETDDEEELKAWLAGLLDADGCIKKRLRSGWLAGEITSSNPKLILLTISTAWKLRIKASLTVSCTKQGRLRKHPVYHVYLRPIDTLKLSIKAAHQ